MKHKYIVGIYDDDDKLVDAVKRFAQEGYRVHECFTPFPVHGLDIAMNLQDTRLHTAGFVYGATGTLTAVITMTLIQVLDWPLIVGGKPFFALPSFVPITFELTVLFAAVGMTVTYYLRNGFSIFKPVEIVDRRTTDCKFALVMCCKQYNKDDEQQAIRQLMRETGAEEVNDRLLNNELLPNLYKHGDEHAHAAHH